VVEKDEHRTSNIQVSEDSDIERRMKKQRSNKEFRVYRLLWKMNAKHQL